MPLRISPPIKKKFLLTDSDKKFKCKGTSATFRQVSQGDNELRNDLFADFKRTVNVDGSTTILQRISFDDIKRLEIFLTLADCNIEDEDGSPLFKFRDGRLTDEVSFKKSWGKLPPVVANEMHEKCLEQNPMWSEAGENGDDDDDNPLEESLTVPEAKSENTTEESTSP